MKAEKNSAAVELGRLRMKNVSKEERRAFALLGVAARKKRPAAKRKPTK